MELDNSERELIGYADPWSVRPGEALRLMISSSHDEYEVSVVRLCGSARENSRSVREVQTLTRKGRLQRAKAGSFATVTSGQALGSNELSITMWVWTAAMVNHEQGLLSTLEGDTEGWALLLDAKGHPLLRATFDGAMWEARADAPVRPREWTFLCAALDNTTRTAAIHIAHMRPLASTGLATVRSTMHFPVVSGPNLMIGVTKWSAEEAPTWGVGHFNGKIENPSIFSVTLTDEQLLALLRGLSPEVVAPNGVLASWDFSRAPESMTAMDDGPSQLHARLVNAPTRAVTSHSWRGVATDFALAPREYSAIHFHEDDLADAAWAPDVEMMIPRAMPSGVYAARLRADGVEDDIPFVVRPRSQATSPSVALLLPTYTYLAYANGRRQFRNSMDVGPVCDPSDYALDRHPEWGLSLYDRHVDGSGCSISSRLRPIPNFRPWYRNWYTGSRRHFAADLYIVEWLEHLECDYDVVTDEDVHRDGVDLLDRYRVVVTGSHPEYCTGAMLDALEGHVASGGRLMYLGGNGFYWVTSISDDHPHLIEVRRGHSGTRTWGSLPGEELHATGERGGLWRNRGRPPNRLVGVGFAAQGVGMPAPGFRRTKASYVLPHSWVFEGVGEDVIGSEGWILGGAAGDEVDRYDTDQGTPSTAVVLASAVDYPRGYTAAVDDVLTLSTGDCSNSHPNVRADLVLIPLPSGGAVFSVSSMTWAGALPVNACDNSASRVTSNVLQRFLDPARLPT